MEQLATALEPYQRFDPTGWVGVFRLIPTWGGALALGIGVLMALFGGRRLFRLVAAPLGALIAQIWAAPLAVHLGFGNNAKQIVIGSTFALAISGLFWPPMVVFFAFGVPAGLIGGQLAGDTDWFLGFGPGFFLGGAMGVVMHRLVGAILSAALGAWVAVLGLMALLRPVVPAVNWLAGSPVFVLAVAACVAIAGGVFQIFVRPSEEQARAKKIEDKLNKRKAREQKALEARWEKYNNRSE